MITDDHVFMFLFLFIYFILLFYYFYFIPLFLVPLSSGPEVIKLI